jgi:DNA-directed RNA polymerase specialized sigma24 family protein
MRDDEFAEYATARWSALVGSAVLLGCPPSDAEDLAQVTLMRAYAAWSKVSAANDRDSYVYRILLNAFRERHRRRWGSPPRHQLSGWGDSAGSPAGAG